MEKIHECVVRVCVLVYVRDCSGHAQYDINNGDDGEGKSDGDGDGDGDGWDGDDDNCG
jgi:hypothetical protein